MPQTFSRANPSPMMRFFSAALAFLLLAWYVLPSCHCQWEHLLGNSPADANYTSDTGNPLTIANSQSDPAPCLCESECGKVFDLNVTDLPIKTKDHSIVNAEVVVTSRLSSYPLCKLNRGPPPGSTQPFPTQATYLRHCSFLI